MLPSVHRAKSGVRVLATDQALSGELNVRVGHFICNSLSEQFSDTDQVDLGGGLVIKDQSIGVASSATGFQDVDGILGCVVLSPTVLLFL